MSSNDISNVCGSFWRRGISLKEREHNFEFSVRFWKRSVYSFRKFRIVGTSRRLSKCNDLHLKAKETAYMGITCTNPSPESSSNNSNVNFCVHLTITTFGLRLSSRKPPNMLVDNNRILIENDHNVAKMIVCRSTIIVRRSNIVLF